MSSPPAAAGAARAVDGTAVAAVLRRLARAPEPPWLHREVARRMAERLPLFALQPERVIDWCGWLGAGGEALRAAYPQAEHVVVEPDAALQARSAAALQRPWWSPKRWSGAPARVLRADQAPAGPARLLWANMVLHGVVDPPALFAHWHRLVAVDGLLLFSCLGPGTLRELHALYRRLGWPSPGAEFVDMHDLGDMLVHAGFADPVMDQETLTLHWADAAALLVELRGLGGNVSPGRAAGLRTPRWRERLLAELGSLAGAGRGPTLRFEIAYGHAFRAARRARPGEPTTVSLDEMRALIRKPPGRALG